MQTTIILAAMASEGEILCDFSETSQQSYSTQPSTTALLAERQMLHIQLLVYKFHFLCRSIYPNCVQCDALSTH